MELFFGFWLCGIVTLSFFYVTINRFLNSYVQEAARIDDRYAAVKYIFFFFIS